MADVTADLAASWAKPARGAAARQLLAVGVLSLGAFLGWLLNWSDREPQLKLSRGGLWSSSFGFRPWSTLGLRIQDPIRFRSSYIGYTFEVRDEASGRVLQRWEIRRLDISVDELNNWLLQLTGCSYL